MILIKIREVMSPVFSSCRPTVSHSEPSPPSSLAAIPSITPLITPLARQTTCYSTLSLSHSLARLNIRTHMDGVASVPLWVSIIILVQWFLGMGRRKLKEICLGDIIGFQLAESTSKWIGFARNWSQLGWKIRIFFFSLFFGGMTCLMSSWNGKVISWQN